MRRYPEIRKQNLRMAALLILGIELALSGRPKTSMICAALAFGFKLSAFVFCFKL